MPVAQQAVEVSFTSATNVSFSRPLTFICNSLNRTLSEIRPPIHSPAFVEVKHDASSSFIEATPQDEIAPFSSATRRAVDENEDGYAHTQSSPSTVRAGNGYALVLKPAAKTVKTHEKTLRLSEDEDLPSLDDILAQVSAKDKAEALKKRKDIEIARRKSDSGFRRTGTTCRGRRRSDIG